MGRRYVTIALIFALTAGAATHSRRRRGHAERVSAPRVEINPASINSSQEKNTILVGDRGSAVVRAQILLARAHFSCGQIDGNFGSNLVKTVAAFQGVHNLSVTGIVDDPTWNALDQDNAPALVTYTIVAADEKGPFVQVPPEMAQQATLPYLGYSSPLEEVAERFHASAALIEALNPGADFGRAGQQLTVPNVLVPPPGQAARVVVSKSDNSVRAYDASGRLLAFYVATIGSEHDPLPMGMWRIRGVAHDPYFHYNPDLFWDARKDDPKATIRPGPRNPVGLVWIDLSKEHYGIHGTPYPSLIGHASSHGCIRLTNWDALQLAAMVKPGVEADLRE